MEGPIRINPPSLFDSTGIGYSQISLSEPGRLAFISGQVAWDAGEAPTPEGFQEQAALVVRNCKTALSEAGTSPANLLNVRAYVVNLDRERVAEIVPYLKDLFEGAQPSLTCIGVASLASPDLLLEIEMVARVPS